MIKRILFPCWHGLSHYHNTRDLVFSSHEIDVIEKKKKKAPAILLMQSLAEKKNLIEACVELQKHNPPKTALPF